MARAAQFVKNLRPFRLVTFDITDTLLKFRDSPAEQYAKTAEEHGVRNVDRQRLEQCFRQEFKYMATKHPNFGCHTPHMSWEQWWIQLVENLFHSFDKKIPPQTLRLIAENLLTLYRTRACWEHVEGARDLLHQVRMSGKIVGVISNSDPSLEKVLHEMEIVNNFDFILTSYESGVQKPHSKIFKIPLELYKLQAKDALHIGNLYEVDYLGARNAGWCSLLVCKNPREAKDAKQTHVYESIADMLNALETTNIEW